MATNSTNHTSTAEKFDSELDQQQFRAPENVDLETMQSDPNSPLYSEVASFKDLNLRKELLDAVYDLKYNRPSRIQAKALPLILNSDKLNLVAQSQSGTGKTATFGLGVLQLIKEEVKVPQAIILAPTLELADQITHVLQALSKYTQIKVRAVLKGDFIKEQIQDHVVIGTPGKIIDILKRKHLDSKGIRYFVIDEADQLLEEGSRSMRDDCLKIKAHLKGVRVFLFSATYGEDDLLTGDESEKQKIKEQKVNEFAKKIVPQPLETILVPKEELTIKAMKQFMLPCMNEQEKEAALKNMFDELTVGQTIIFMNRRDAADELCRKMKADGFTVSVLHAQLSPSDRKKTVNDFKTGATKVLISTNVLSRGLDIPTVTHVVNYDLPFLVEKTTGRPYSPLRPDPTTYLHRVGRTSRFGRSGFAINMCVGEEEIRIIKQLEQYFAIKIEEINRDDIAEKIR